MKKFILIFFVVALAFISFEFCTTNETSAKGKKGKTSASIQVFSNDGEQTIYGSILIPTADDANVALPPNQLAKVRKSGVSKLTVTLTSALDSTKTYTVPTESVTVQNRKLKKKSGKFLVVNLFSITNQSGITVSPSSLPGDQYKLTISDGKDINITTSSFTYEPPALVVGTAKTKSTGVVTVEDLEGDMISDKSVITSNNGAFFTEVRAKNLPSNTTTTKNRKLSAQTEDESNTLLEDDTEPGVVAVNIDEDKDAELEALVPLSTNPDANEAISENEAIEVTEETTQELDYLKAAAEGDEEALNEIADQAVKQKLDDITGGTSTSSSGGLPTPSAACPDVKLLANRCDKPDAALGNDVKSTYFSVCNFEGKEFIEKLPLEKIAEVYCKHATKGEEKGSPCDVYEKFVLPNAKGPKPVCPPPECTKFASILKNCVQPFGVCGGPQGGPAGPGPITRLAQVSGPSPGSTPGGPGQCFVKKPPRDLFCFEIDAKDGVPASECIPDPTNPGPDWAIGDAGNGKKFCVPSKLQGGFFPPGESAPTTPNDIARQLCVLTRCHKDCESQFGKPSFTGLEQTFGGSTAGGPGGPGTPGGPSGPGAPGGGFGFPQDCKVCKCHQTCDAKSGRPVCDFGSGIVTKGCCTSTTFAAQQFGGFGSGMGGFGGPGPIPLGGDLRSCLCKDLTANFGSDKVATDVAVESCKKSCPDPDKYEPGKLSNGQEACLPICEKFGQGLVRDEGGGCKKGKGGQDNCPASCSQYVRKFLEQTTGGTQPSGFGGSTGDIPPECKPCFGGGFGGGQCPPDKPVKCPDGLCKPSQAECGKGECPPDQKFDPVTQKCIGGGPCPQDKPIKCPDGSCRVTQLECASTSSGGTCPQTTPIRCPDGSCKVTQLECTSTSSGGTCPQATPIRCPDGSCKVTQLECTSTSSGGTCPQTTPIRCPDGSCRVTQLECASTSSGGTCPQATPIRCPDGSCKVTQLECTSTSSGGTCPQATPIMCPDNSCQVTLAACPCPAGQTKCSDGTCQITCTSTSSSGGGGDTCPQATPIRCPDNSCQTTLAACPCPAGQTKCSDGTCQITCPCPQATPIRCPDNSCQTTLAACPCPAGQTKCPDGTCQITCPSSGGGQNCPAGSFFCSASNTCKPTGSPCP